MTNEMYKKLQEISYLLVTQDRVWAEHFHALNKMVDSLNLVIADAMQDREKVNLIIDKCKKKEEEARNK